LIVAAALVVLAALAIVVSLDLRSWRSSLDEGDARYVESPGAARWATSTVLPSALGRDLLGVDDDVAARRAIRLFRVADRARGGLDTALERQGTRAAHVVVLGGGVAGSNAVAVAVGLEAQVTVLDTNIARLRELDAHYMGRVRTIASNSFEIERAVLDADLVIGSVLVPGAKAPKLVTNALVERMRPGSVLVDIAIDQGGCFEDSRPTTHADPTFTVHQSLFYCVANMPGAVANTSTYALTNATLPYVRSIANAGWREALRTDAALARGLNVHAGHVVNPAVAHAHGLEFEESPLGLA
jgi:alanine dehydrogenase